MMPDAGMDAGMFIVAAVTASLTEMLGPLAEGALLAVLAALAALIGVEWRTRDAGRTPPTIVTTPTPKPTPAPLARRPAA